MTWTIDTLKEHLEQRFSDSDKAVQAALQAAKEAVIKAETAADKRFELLNELRDGVATKEQLEAVEKLVGGLADRINRTEGASDGSRVTKASFYATIGIVGTILGILVLLSNNVFGR